MEKCDAVEGVLGDGRKAAVCGGTVRGFRDFPQDRLQDLRSRWPVVVANFCFSNRFFSSARSRPACGGEAVIGRMDTARQIGANLNSMSTLTAVRSVDRLRRPVHHQQIPVENAGNFHRIAVDMYAKRRVCQAPRAPRKLRRLVIASMGTIGSL
jgi:hypothetical protein